MDKNITTNSTIIAAALAALLAAPLSASPAGTAGKVAGRAAARAVGKEVAEEAAERIARETAEKVAVRVARESAEEAAKKASAKVAREATERATVKGVVGTVAKPKMVLAGGAATAMVIGSHNVSKGARTAMEDVAESVKEVADKHPEMLPTVLEKATKPFSKMASAIQYAVGFAVLCMAFWFFAAPLRLLRARMSERAEQSFRRRQTWPNNGTGDKIVDAEYEVREP